MRQLLPGRWGLGLLLWLVGLVLIPSVVVAKPQPTIAVMPFRDLTGKGKPHIGEAIREVVASDLKSLAGVRIVERGNLDKVLKEMRVQAQLKEVEDDTAAKLGKVVGASVMVLGAYQEESAQIRLTARFVRVETSEIIGSAKVDGSVKQFFRLQDRVTAELLRSAGMPELARKVVDGTEARPDLKTIEALDLYGQAVTAENDQQKLVLLSSAVAIDQNFSYAVKDLAALEERIQKYQAEQKRLTDAKITELRKDLATTTERAKLDALTDQLLRLLQGSRRYHALVREARLYLEGLPPGPVSQREFDSASVMLVSTDLLLRDYDSVLRDGEVFMQRAPSSAMFESVRQMVSQAIDSKRQAEEGKQKLAEYLQKFPNLIGWDLCTLASVYSSHRQFKEAQRLFDACIKVSDKPAVSHLQAVVMVDMMLGDYAAMQRHIDEAEKLEPSAGRSLRNSYAIQMPVD
ncbi:MAG TPA: CsgG/HfaB family protein [Pseudomonadota bacterium]|nr:CsgG/HfaB family protein [Pseudomonadota bacterium]